MKDQERTIEDHETFQERTFFGQEKKPLPVLLGLMNMVLHGVIAPRVVRRNTLEAWPPILCPAVAPPVKGKGPSSLPDGILDRIADAAGRGAVRGLGGARPGLRKPIPTHRREWSVPLNPGPRGIFEWPEWRILKSALTKENLSRRGKSLARRWPSAFRWR